MPVYQQYPKRAVMWPHDDTITAGDTTFVGATPSGTASSMFSYWTQSTAALNDERTNGFFVAAGTYTITIRYIKATSAATLTCYVDGTSIGTADMYAAATAEGSTVFSNVSITTPGWHQFKIKATSKNASSSNYKMFMEVYSVKQSSD